MGLVWNGGIAIGEDEAGARWGAGAGMDGMVVESDGGRWGGREGRR